ncbi:MAG: FlgD immunoglobulin-like domain containing protein [Candidatus Latescibacterota bacterium]
MTPYTRRIQSLLFVCISVLLLLANPKPANSHAAKAGPQLTDSLYNAHHPRLLFNAGELAALISKVRDGGHDDAVYAFIRLATELTYPAYSMEELLDNDYALEALPNLGLTGFLEIPADTTALAIGRHLTLYLAENYAVDNNDFDSSLRLRSLALGYDMFFGNSPEFERELVRSEIISYIDKMTGSRNYEIWLYRPYLGNRSMMIAASVGMAAICLQDETDPAKITAALDFADDIIDEWLHHQMDEQGAYNEGVVYGSWSMRMLIYYSHARKRYDGYNYSSINRIRNMENWFAYELLPEGFGRTNNLNDCAYKDYILSRHHTYVDWAQAEWGSRLSSWIWDHTAGEYGWDWELDSDNAATILWNQNLPPEPPDNILPRSFLWAHRGLYYYRSGWEMGPNSNDVAFSFYSGLFQGAHAQEDQGQFTLYGYGAKFAIDHGPGSIARQSEAHNMVFIDNLGQHNAGSSIGTDGMIREYLLSNYADYLASDLTDAYTTHSKWNNPNIPFPGTDWSWGYSGANPVRHAFRSVVVVHDTDLPPYFIILDDIDKDGLTHQYAWRMHTLNINSVETSTDPMRISHGTSYLDIHLIEPSFASVQKSVIPFDNLNDEPDASILSLSVADTCANFALLLFPGNETVPAPAVRQDAYTWGCTVTLDWGGGMVDIFARNTFGGTVTYSPNITVSSTRAPSLNGDAIAKASSDSIVTNASLSLVQFNGPRLIKYLLASASEFSLNDTSYVHVTNGPVSCGLSDGTIWIDRFDADFTFYAPAVNMVLYRTQQIHVISQGGYLTPDPTTGTEAGAVSDFSFRATAYPNPLNPTTVIQVELPDRAFVGANIYDCAGRLIRTVWRGAMPQGTSKLTWNGVNEKGIRVASGVYFLRIQSRAYSKTIKLVVVK